MFIENLINIPWIYVEATGNNHIFLTVHNIEVSIIIHSRDITRIAPAVAQQGRGFFWFSQIAFGNLRTANNQFSRLAYRHIFFTCVQINNPAFGIGNRQADAADFADAAERVCMRNWCCLRHAETFDDNRPGNFLKLMDNFDRQWSAPGKTTFDACHISFLNIRMTQQADIHGGNQGGKRWFEFLNGFHQGFRLGSGNQNVSPSLIHGKVHNARHSENMENWQCSKIDSIDICKHWEPGADLLHLLA